MGDKSKIEWTEASWNPTTGCSKVSPGCAHCYAESLSLRYGWSKKPWTPANAAENVILHPDRLELPLRWQKPRRVFVDSMSDLFHEEIPDEFIDRVFAVMALTPQHTYQVLTKRPERMREYMTKERTAHFSDGTPVPARNPYHSDDFIIWAAQRICDEGYNYPGEYPTGEDFDWPLPGVWLGVSTENQHWADERIPILLETPAAVRFISAEPLLGPLLLHGWLGACWCGETDCDHNEARLSWIIVGGESGPKHRPFNPDWARSIVRQCAEAGVACFVKQLGGARPGTKLEDLPEDLRVREYPATHAMEKIG